MATIGLVTVLFKSNDVLPGFFKSISIQDYTNYILYFVDNSYNEDTTQLIENLQTQYSLTAVRHINTGGNTGVAAGNNAGIKAAILEGCTHVLLLNNDIEFQQSFVFTQMMNLSLSKNNAMVVPKIFYYDNPKLWMAGGYMDKWRALGVHYGMGKKDAPAFNKPRYITYAPTCFMLIHKSVFDKVGYMDEKYFAYYDDTDFVFRAIQAGKTLYYDPSVVILHKVSSSTGDNSAFYVYYSNRNKIYFIRKNLRKVRKWVALLYTIFSRIFFWLKFDTARKKKLVEGIGDGFKIPV